MKKKVGIALAIIGGISVLAAGTLGALYVFSDKIYKRYLPCEDDFDMLVWKKRSLDRLIYFKDPKICERYNIGTPL